MPIVSLHLRGFPRGTTSDTIIFLLRYFGSVYRVRLQGDEAICTMSSETGRSESFSFIEFNYDVVILPLIS